MENRVVKNSLFTKDFIGIMTSIAYVAFGIIHIWGNNSKLFLIPLVLYAANFLLIIDFIRAFYKHPSTKSKSNLLWIIFYTSINVLGVVLSFMLFD